MRKVFIVVISFAVLVLGSDYAYANVIEVPEPSTLILLGSGLIALVAFRKRSRKS